MSLTGNLSGRALNALGTDGSCGISRQLRLVQFRLLEGGLQMRIPYRYVGVLAALVGISACSSGGGRSSVPGAGPAGSQPASQSRGVLSVGGPTCNVPADYPTIQAAVNVPACATINVAAGTYAESVIIARALTLKGAQAGADARSPRGGESIITSGPALPDITISANSVTVDGFTLNGPLGGGTAAIVMMGANSGETIKNNVVNNPGRAASFNTSNTVFTRNLVNGNATSSDGFQANTTPVQNVTVADNTFRGVTAPPNTYHADLTFIEGNSNIIVTGNRSTGDGTLVALFKTNGAIVAGNTVIGDLATAGPANASSAIYVGGSDTNITVIGNTVSSAGSAVNVTIYPDPTVGLGPDSRVTITGNNLHNNLRGIRVGPTAVTSANTVVAHRNRLTGNAEFGVKNESTFNVDATCNWWGARNGPGPVGPGSGDKVTTNVTFAPWLTSADLDSRCNGTPNGGGGDRDDGHGGHDGDNERHDRD
jgi:hypothetical protein